MVYPQFGLGFYYGLQASGILGGVEPQQLVRADSATVRADSAAHTADGK